MMKSMSSNAGGYEALSAASRKTLATKQLLIKSGAALMILAALIVFFRSFLLPSPRVYGLMIDAGSTGSRMHTFRFTKASSGKLALIDEDFFPVKPGLSASADDPAAAAESLEPLIARARTIVPASDRARTPVFLRATAGLRMTGNAKAAAILAKVADKLGASGFRFDGPEWATILGGSDEGIYSWITVNSLLDRPAADTVGTLEMGGGSAQVAFVPKDDAAAKGAASGNCSTPTERTPYKGALKPLYTFSNLKFGLKAGRAQALRSFEENRLLQRNPCINPDGVGDNTAKGVVVPIPFDEKAHTLRLSGSGKYLACRALVDKYVTKPAYETCGCGKCTYHGVAAPAPIPEYYAFAFYLERTVALGMNTPVLLSDLRAKGEQVCAMTVAQIRAAYPAIPNGEATDLCLDLAFITSHLEWGHGITEAAGTKLHIVDKIKGVELGWSLGAMLKELGTLGIGH